MAPKKAKSKDKGKGSENKVDLPNPEWSDKSFEELRSIVAQLECDLEAKRKSRSLAQVEHGSLQSYHDVTREQIRELDMKIEKRELEIENTEEDNAVELRVYKQKSNFIHYCHDNKLKESSNNYDVKIQAAASDHEKQVAELEVAKSNRRKELQQIEEKNTQEIKELEQTNKEEILRVKHQLDTDIKSFHEKCTKQHTDLKQELESRRAAELETMDSRKKSHLKDLMKSHEATCDEIRKYFERVEKEQQIDMEDLQAEIRKLKKAAVQNSTNSNNLKENNQESGEELKQCLETVANLKTKTKDKDKNFASLKHTNVRLSVTQNSIREARERYHELEVKFAKVEEERNSLKRHMYTIPPNQVCKSNSLKQTILKDKLSEQSDANEKIEHHLRHIINSAGLDEAKSNSLLSNVNTFLQECSEETEKLNLAIANATKLYYADHQSCRSQLLKLNVPSNEIDSIKTLNESIN